MNKDSEEWITTADAKALTGYNAEHIRRLVRAGKIKAKKWGKEWMIERNALLKYLESEGRGPRIQSQT
ncbi:MAG TPA: helix-turn-helix domain-containing protein [Cyclobacteriaceae bacterium]|nr:helix-turn-helix domain-containing protein [Cyclobacteriaceae bacterium]